MTLTPEILNNAWWLLTLGGWWLVGWLFLRCKEVSFEKQDEIIELREALDNTRIAFRQAREAVVDLVGPDPRPVLSACDACGIANGGCHSLCSKCSDVSPTLDLLRRMRDHAFNAMTKGGGFDRGHDHPIWREVAEAVDNPR